MSTILANSKELSFRKMDSNLLFQFKVSVSFSIPWILKFRLKREFIADLYHFHFILISINVGFLNGIAFFILRRLWMEIKVKIEH